MSAGPGPTRSKSGPDVVQDEIAKCNNITLAVGTFTSMPKEDVNEINYKPKEDKGPASSKSFDPIFSYEAVVWTVFLATTACAIIDRFTTNIWPRQAFSIGGGSTGNDRLVGYKPGPWSVVAYDVIARITGRFSICCFNILLITRLRSLEHALLCSPWVNRLLDCRNIIKANIRIHRWNAIALSILTLVHVWSILLPCMTHGYSAQVVVGYFEYPLSERPPSGFKDANPDTKTMSLEVDDVWRMVEMTLLFCVFIPLSVRWFATRWHIGMPLHRLTTTLYFVDIVRRHTHPHSWVLNTPVFCAWILDKCWFWYSNRSVSPKVHRVKLGQDYMVLYWSHPHNGNSIVAPDYFMRLNDSSLLESAHVFSAFENRVMSKYLPNEFPFEWSVGTVIRIFREKRIPNTGAKDPISHTSRMFDAPEDAFDLTAWGAYHSEMSNRLRYDLVASAGPVTLIGAGSGIGFIIDALQWKLKEAPESSIYVLFSTRSVELYCWVQQMVQPFSCNENIKVNLAFTGNKKEFARSGAIQMEEGNLPVHYGHFDFANDIIAPPGSSVFCQGSKFMNEFIAKICFEKKARFYGGLQSPERIEVLDALNESLHDLAQSLSSSVHGLKRYVADTKSVSVVREGLSKSVHGLKQYKF